MTRNHFFTESKHSEELGKEQPRQRESQLGINLLITIGAAATLTVLGIVAYKSYHEYIDKPTNRVEHIQDREYYNPNNQKKR